MPGSNGHEGYEKSVLSNGVRVITEVMPQVRSLALGFWFNVGSRDEPEGLCGISHFLEHMNFKGTPRRNAAAIVRAIEERGGHLNAFTSKEVTCFHVRAIDSQLARTVDVIADITQNSIYDPEELERERRVILEELKSTEDSPDEWALEQFVRQVFGRHAMGQMIIGRRETISAIGHDQLIGYRTDNYCGNRLVIAASGSLDHKTVVKLVEHALSHKPGSPPKRVKPRNSKSGAVRQDLHSNTQQAHICWGCRSLPFDDPRKYALLTMNTILGGGASSRLFQRIRERNGLAYSVYSFLDSFFDTGMFGVYAGTEPKQAEKALRLIVKTVTELAEKSVPAAELKRTQDQLKGSLMLSLESPSARMHRLARLELHTGGFRPLEEVITQIEAVTSDDIKRLAEDLFMESTTYTTVLWPK